jgi:hypothetical protein
MDGGDLRISYGEDVLPGCGRPRSDRDHDLQSRPLELDNIIQKPYSQTSLFSVCFMLLCARLVLCRARFYLFGWPRSIGPLQESHFVCSTLFIRSGVFLVSFELCQGLGREKLRCRRQHWRRLLLSPAIFSISFRRGNIIAFALLTRPCFCVFVMFVYCPISWVVALFIPSLSIGFTCWKFVVRKLRLFCAGVSDSGHRRRSITFLWWLN